MNKNLQRRQQLIDYIHTYTTQNGRAPTYREMAKAIGLTSLSTLAGYIARMRQDGLLEADDSECKIVTRTIRAGKVHSYRVYFDRKTKEATRRGYLDVLACNKKEAERSALDRVYTPCYSTSFYPHNRKVVRIDPAEMTTSIVWKKAE